MTTPPPLPIPPAALATISAQQKAYEMGYGFYKGIARANDESWIHVLWVVPLAFLAPFLLLLPIGAVLFLIALLNNFGSH